MQILVQTSFFLLSRYANLPAGTGTRCNLSTPPRVITRPSQPNNNNPLKEYRARKKPVAI